MSDIDFLLDEENELTFSLKIEGTRPATAQCRLVIENKEISLVFDADSYDGEEVSVVIPALGHVLKEGEYNMELEVIVEDKFFKPLTLVGNFEKSISIVAETVKKKKEVLKPQVSLSGVKVNRKPTAVKNKSVAKKSQKSSKQQDISESKVVLTDNEILALIEALKSK
jgi:hypothetical protein